VWREKKLKKTAVVPFHDSEGCYCSNSGESLDSNLD
jgi:hypothetical protein